MRDILIPLDRAGQPAVKSGSRIRHSAAWMGAISRSASPVAKRRARPRALRRFPRGVSVFVRQDFLRGKSTTRFPGLPVTADKTSEPAPVAPLRACSISPERSRAAETGQRHRDHKRLGGIGEARQMNFIAAAAKRVEGFFNGDCRATFDRSSETTGRIMRLVVVECVRSIAKWNSRVPAEF